MITFDGVAARHAPLALANVSLAWGPGVHAVVGGSADGGLLLLALIAGAARSRAGSVRVLGGAPTDATVRPQVAFIPREPTLPEAMRVGEVLAIASAIRGEPAQDPVVRLRALGLEALAARGVWTLSRGEARGLAIAEAATSTRVHVVLIEEPFVDLDPRAATYLPDVLRGRARDGQTVVVATASVRDAGELADDHVVLRAGAIVGKTSSFEALAGFSPGGVRYRILTSDSLALAGALAREQGVEAVARRNGSVTLRGRDAMDLARAAGRAILASGVDVTEIRVEPPPLDEMRAAVAGVAAATYETALARTRASLATSRTARPGSGAGPPATSQEP